MFQRLISILLLMFGLIGAKTIWFENKEVLISRDDANLAFDSTDECTSPFVVDWDNDGLKDLLVGYWKDSLGYLRFYKNVGTNENKQYQSWTHIQANGTYVTTRGG